MEKILWNVYHQFRCIADKCPDSCCQGWEVDIDPETAEFYRSREDQLADTLRSVMRTENGETSMILQNGRCPMWREDGLCRIHAQWGHDALCAVCREYPRLYLDYGDFAEWGLEMSCPEAARLMFLGLQTETVTLEATVQPEYDAETMAILQRSRQRILDYWETITNIPNALAVTLLYAHGVQSEIDGGDVAVLDPDAFTAIAGRCKGDLSPILELFQSLEILTEDWKTRLQNPAGGPWDPRLRVMAQYLIRRYWLQAVWDMDLVCRVKFMVTACILVHGLGGDTVQTAQLFSKEIENDPDNRDTLYDSAYSSPALTDANLLGLLI